MYRLTKGRNNVILLKGEIGQGDNHATDHHPGTVRPDRQLIGKIENGESFIVTKEGNPVAEIVSL